jgi:hypothetical protein
MATRGRPKKAKEDLTKPVTFRLPQKYLELLEDAKWSRRLNKVDVVKEALDDYFKKHKIGE